jgi:hypothetical protein
LDRDIKSLERVWDCLREVLLGLLNGNPSVGLADVEKILRWGDCNVFLIARPPPIVGKVKGIIENGRGERCEWFYDMVYGIPDLLRDSFEKYDCENSRQNMERLEKAGHIVRNYDAVKKEMERAHPEMMKKKMAEFKKKKMSEVVREEKPDKEAREEYRAEIHEEMAKRKEKAEAENEKEAKEKLEKIVSHMVESALEPIPSESSESEEEHEGGDLLAAILGVASNSDEDEWYEEYDDDAECEEDEES